MKIEALNVIEGPKDGDTIVVWFSCGAASAVAAKKTIERYGDRCLIRVVNNPIADEDEDNQRFLADVEKWLGLTIEYAINPAFPNCSIEEVWEKSKAMSFPMGAPCTHQLKKKARQIWESHNETQWMVLGFTLEELGRHSRFVMSERDNSLPVLIDARITKADCYQIITEAGIDLPRTYFQGWPNANCPGCSKGTSPTYWNHVRKLRPDVFDRRSEMSRRLGVRLVRHKGKRIFLDELQPDAKGRPMKNMQFECGIFCEESTA